MTTLLDTNISLKFYTAQLTSGPFLACYWKVSAVLAGFSMSCPKSAVRQDLEVGNEVAQVLSQS